MQRVLFFILCFIAAIAAHEATAMPDSYFDMAEARSDDITPFYKWTRMATRFDEQRTIPDSQCDKVRFHPCVIMQWKALLNSIRNQPFVAQLDIVNDWANKYPYIANEINWGPEDYWETPYEFMEVSGDCKDYAIAKYYSLLALGVPREKLRLIVLQDLNLGGIIHAVLGVYDSNDRLLILDNQSHQVLPALKIYHYRPIYGINEDAWWAYYPKRG